MSFRHAVGCLLVLGCSPQLKLETRTFGSADLDLAPGEESLLVSVPDNSDCAPAFFYVNERIARGRALLRGPTRVAFDGERRVEIIRKRKVGAGTRFVDLNVFLLASTGLGAAAAPKNPRLQHALAVTNDLLAQARIQLGTVRYFDGKDDPGAVTFYPCDMQMGLHPGAASQLFSQAHQAPLAVNAFLVAQIDTTTNAPADAYAVGGFSPVPGFSDGLVLLFDHFDQRDDALGHTLAHEVGHFLGLHHVVERDGSSVDDIDDTPKADPDAASNLMRWSGDGAVLTPGQIAQIRAHPLVY